MIKTFEQIKKEYAEDIRAYSVKVRMAEDKVSCLTANLDNAEAERWKCCQGEITHEKCEMRKYWDFRISDWKKQVEDAKNELAMIKAGENNVNEILKNIGF